MNEEQEIALDRCNAAMTLVTGIAGDSDRDPTEEEVLAFMLGQSNQMSRARVLLASVLTTASDMIEGGLGKQMYSQMVFDQVALIGRAWSSEDPELSPFLRSVLRAFDPELYTRLSIEAFLKQFTEN